MRMKVHKISKLLHRKQLPFSELSLVRLALDLVD